MQSQGDIKIWLKSLLIGEFGSIEKAFESMQVAGAPVFPRQLSSAIEEAQGIKLERYDLARILWSLDIDPGSEQPYSIDDWVERFARIESDSDMIRRSESDLAKMPSNTKDFEQIEDVGERHAKCHVATGT